MSDRIVTVTAPSRLHFGMLSFGHPDVRQYGGLGLMIEHPRLQLRFSPGDRLTCTGPQSELVSRFAERFIRGGLFAEPPRCRIEVLQSPEGRSTADDKVIFRRHIGLGSGTQAALAVAAGLSAWCGGPLPDPIKLAAVLGRAGRSAVGTHGFARGGLLVEAGRRYTDLASPLVARVDFPLRWRFVLLIPHVGEGLSGRAEERAFDQLPPVPSETTNVLCREVLLNLLPAAMQADFDAFSESLYRYGHLSGGCFGAVQGGPFATPELARRVELIRSLGVAGAGQSSWGPVLYALCSSHEQAARLIASLKERLPADIEYVTTAADNRGAQVETRAA
jgi:beta-ribofuranosylaminobenzene 5'-phosphate synthase